MQKKQTNWQKLKQNKTKMDQRQNTYRSRVTFT